MTISKTGVKTQIFNYANKEKNDGDVEVSTPVTTPETETTESSKSAVPMPTLISYL